MHNLFQYTQVSQNLDGEERGEGRKSANSNHWHRDFFLFYHKMFSLFLSTFIQSKYIHKREI